MSVEGGYYAMLSMSYTNPLSVAIESALEKGMC